MPRSHTKRSTRIKSGNARKALRKIQVASLPLYCDYSCPHAKFGEEDAIGACRKELAVYCTLLNQYHTKNLKCLVKP